MYFPGSPSSGSGRHGGGDGGSLQGLPGPGRDPGKLVSPPGSPGGTARTGFSPRPHNLQLWRREAPPPGTAGSPATVGLASSRARTAPLPPDELTPFGGRLFFAPTTASTASSSGRATAPPAGTVLVRDIFPGPALLAAARAHRRRRPALLLGRRRRSTAIELWQSDGTAAGTRLVQDIAPRAALVRPAQLTDGRRPPLLHAPTTASPAASSGPAARRPGAAASPRRPASA